MMPGQQCETCSASGAVRQLGSRYICHECAEVILEPIRDRHFIDECGIGWGRQSGSIRSEYGVRFAELTCGVCAASWVGVIGEPCNYCIERHKRLEADHATALLRPGAHSIDTDAKLKAWAQRLADAVNAGLVDKQRARSAWQREVMNRDRVAA